MFGQVVLVSTIERKASLNLIIRLFCLKEKNAFLLYIIFLYSFDITFIYFDFVLHINYFIIFNKLFDDS